MIDVKQIAKPKGDAKAAGKSAAYRTYTVTDTARKAYRAEFADRADYADKAGTASRAASADKAMELSEDSPVRDMFLRRLEDDTAQGLITFLKGIVAKGQSVIDRMTVLSANIDSLNGRELVFKLGVFDGLEAETLDLLRSLTALQGTIDELTAKTIEAADTVTKNLKATAATVDVMDAGRVTTHELEVTGAAHFFELVIDKVRAAGGRILLTAATAGTEWTETLMDDEGNTVYRCYFRCSYGQGSIGNEWRKDDMAICQTMNVTALNTGSGTISTGFTLPVSLDKDAAAANRYYWRRVTGVSEQPRQYRKDEGDEELYHYIDLSSTDYDPVSNAAPVAGDTIVQLGSWNDEERSNAIILSAYNNGWLDTELEAPSMAQYTGIGLDESRRWDLKHCRYTYFAANGNSVTGKLKVTAEGGARDVKTELDLLAQGFQIYAERTEKAEKTLSETKHAVDLVGEQVDSIEYSQKELGAQMEELPLKTEQEVTTLKAEMEVRAEEISTRVTEENVKTIQESIDGIPIKTEEELEKYTSSINQTSREITLEITAETKEALKRTGIDIEAGTITLDAMKTVITGNLWMKGILVQNSEEVTWEGCTDGLVVCDMTAHCSVSVEGGMKVILPMKDAVAVTDSTGNTHSVGGMLTAGVKLTISARYQPEVAKWSQGRPEQYTDSVMETMQLYAVRVFADPRIASKDNYTEDGNLSGIDPLGGGGYATSGYEGGVFVCNGRRGRILLMMPGQSLHLTSAIETINGTEHLMWYVDNGSEYVPIDKTAWFYDYSTGFTALGGSAFPMETGSSSGSEYLEAMFAPKQLGDSYGTPATAVEIQMIE